MTVDHDGKIRMDCSSPYAMAGLVRLKDDFDIAWGNDPDSDRHGIVTRSAGLMNPNHYLAVAIQYLLGNRPHWPQAAVVGKTLVSSAMIDRVVSDLGRTLWEVPVGFKWFAPGLFDGSCCFGGEESAGASFLRRDGGVWTTDKDGLDPGACSPPKSRRAPAAIPGEHYAGADAAVRRDLLHPHRRAGHAGAEAGAEPALARGGQGGTLAGDAITAKLTRAPGNNAPIGGLKVVSAGGWFAARPSGTEDIYKLYAESFRERGALARDYCRSAVDRQRFSVSRSTLTPREKSPQRTAPHARGGSRLAYATIELKSPCPPLLRRFARKTFANRRSPIPRNRRAPSATFSTSSNRPTRTSRQANPAAKPPL